MREEHSSTTQIPYALKEAQANGKLAIFVGAGVSKGSPSNLPTYRELAKKLAGEVRVPFDPDKDQPYDQFIGKLSKQSSGIHDKAREIYGSPESKPTNLHLLLLQLFKDSESVRIVTTNYDRHLSTASRQVFPKSAETKLFAAPALPLGRRYNGIVHLHGSVDQDAHELILTDADFGRAYLTEGWARRFLVSALDEYVTLYVGYSHEDPLLSYLALGLFPGSKRFAFSTEDKADHWRRLGVDPIEYPIAEENERHKPLSDLISGWVELIEMRPTDHLTRIRQIAESHNDRLQGPLPVQDENYLSDALKNDSNLQHFVRYAKGLFWLEWLDRSALLDRLFEVSGFRGKPAEFSGRHYELLTEWFAENFTSAGSSQFLDFVRKKGQVIHPYVWHAMTQKLAGGKDIPEPGVFSVWVNVLLDCAPHEQQYLNPLNSIVTREFSDQHSSTIVLLFEFLTRPKSTTSPRPLRDGSTVDVNITMTGNSHSVQSVWRKRLKPLLPTVATDLACIITSHLRRAHSILADLGKAGNDWDPISQGRSAIEDHEQDTYKYGFDVLIDFARDTIEFLVVNNISYGNALTYEWSASRVPILQRLAIHGIKMNSTISQDEKLEWLLARDWLYELNLKHEVFQLLATALPQATESVQADVVDRALRGPARSNSKKDDGEVYEVYNLLYWLSTKAPDCGAAQEAFLKIQRENPQFKPRDHPDLGMWISRFVHVGGVTPQNVDDLLAKKPSEWVDYLMDYRGDELEGPHREGLMNSVRQAAKTPQWGLGLAHALEKKGVWKADIWEAVLLAWEEAQFTEEQWLEILNTLSRNEIVQGFSIRVSSILWNSAEKNRIPANLIGNAEVVAERVWQHSDQDEPEQAHLDDWLFEAINHPAGQLILFWLHAMSLRLKGDLPVEETVSKTFWTRLSDIIEKSSYACQLGRIIIASQVTFLYTSDRGWTRNHVLPILDWTVDPDRAEQCWHGFTAWGQLIPEILNDLKPLYKQAIDNFPIEASQIREHLVQHAASMALSLENPQDDGWLNSIVRSLKEKNELGTWARVFRFALGRSPEEIKQRIWETWLKEYWRNRIDGVPFDFEEDELRDTIDWVLELDPVFDEAVDTITAAPAIDPDHTDVYRELAKKDLAKSHPNSTGKLFLYLLSGIKGIMTPASFYLCDDMEVLFHQLRGNGAPKSSLKEIVEEFARIGCPQAAGLNDSLGSG